MGLNSEATVHFGLFYSTLERHGTGCLYQISGMYYWALLCVMVGFFKEDRLLRFLSAGYRLESSGKKRSVVMSCL